MEKPPLRNEPNRAERQAAALRANLKRRKAAAAPRQAAQPGPDAQSPGPDSGENPQG